MHPRRQDLRGDPGAPSPISSRGGGKQFLTAVQHAICLVARTLRPASLCALLVVASACAHARGGPAFRETVETVEMGDAVVRLRYQPDDAQASLQVKEALARAVAAAQRWGRFLEPVVLTIHPTHEGLEAAAQRQGFPWMRAWARRTSVDLQSPRTWSQGRASDAAMTQILTHELTHCVMYQRIAADGSRSTRGVPIWFLEGIASVTAGQRHAPPRPDGGPRSGEDGDPLAAPETLLRLDAARVYATAHQAFQLLVERYGEDRVRRLIAGMGDGRSFPDAFLLAVGVAVQDFERDFRRGAGRLAGVLRSEERVGAGAVEQPAFAGVDSARAPE